MPIGYTHFTILAVLHHYKRFSQPHYLESPSIDFMSNYISDILTTLIEVFNADDLPFTRVEDDTALSLAFKGENGQWMCYARAKEVKEQFIFYSICPVNAPDERRRDMTEFLARANYGLPIGNFELDFRDGEIRYKTSIDVEGAELTPALVRSLVYTNVMTMDTYLPGIMAIIYGNISPEDAIAQIEMRSPASFDDSAVVSTEDKGTE
ncbi:MAG: YbjN domain-containing protein [Xenococcaceae cyanobacterium MO_167.B52]|nr:YbjN domain-containing protein [Xenococcaceae cyanobacterium MO_167.B52]